MDIVSSKIRSRIMAAVPQRNTSPEMMVRRELKSLGIRCRLNDKGLPGSPDIVVVGRKTVIFVHGCFWHRHGCSRTTWPETRAEFWSNKFEQNVFRDRKNILSLRRKDWRVIVIWECSTADPKTLRRRIRRLFDLSVLKGNLTNRPRS
jgi:DNA mismatch endonuclease, patch repair protein